MDFVTSNFLQNPYFSTNDISSGFQFLTPQGEKLHYEGMYLVAKIDPEKIIETIESILTIFFVHRGNNNY